MCMEPPLGGLSLWNERSAIHPMTAGVIPCTISPMGWRTESHVLFGWVMGKGPKETGAHEERSRRNEGVA